AIECGVLAVDEGYERAQSVPAGAAWEGPLPLPRVRHAAGQADPEIEEGGAGPPGAAGSCTARSVPRRTRSRRGGRWPGEVACWAFERPEMRREGDDRLCRRQTAESRM